MYMRFLIYINDLPPTIKTQYKPVLFVNNTNIIISQPEIDWFQNCMNDEKHASLNNMIKVNKLTLNSD
jgi:hypothetical protein